MLITQVELENIKSYRHLRVDFQRGTIAIQGANGAGKTTLVEAIGFALFDSLPYKHPQFVREGEKYGVITVRLIGNDERHYVVTRRCGSGAFWQVYDCEADLKLEQRTDVLDKLHDLFGIERERPLETLFQDALGVPQGTFTAVFLESASRRKKTFDELLQIEDYREAADYLLEVQHCYKDELQELLQEIQRLTFETRDLETWRSELEGLRQQEQRQSEQIAQGNRRLEELEGRHASLQAQRDALQQLRHNYERAQLTCDGARERLRQCQQELSTALQASQEVEASSAAYQAYQQAEAALKELRLAERRRNALRQQAAELQSQLAMIGANVANLSTSLQEIAQAREQVVALAPLADEQRALERRLEELKQQVRRYDELVEEGRALRRQQEQALQRQQEVQQKIARIEPLQPVAARLGEHIASVTRLQARLGERSQKQQQLQERRDLLRQREEEREKLLERLRALEESIATSEAHRSEAEELAALQEESARLSARCHRLEGNIDSYRTSRELSRGGQCPLLHEPCLNIRQRGLASLEAYFSNLIEKEQVLLAELQQQRCSLDERLVLVRGYAQELERLGQYRSLRDECAERLRQLASETLRLRRDLEDLEQDLEELKGLSQQIAEAERARQESEAADRQVRELERLRVIAQQLQETLAQTEEQINEKRRLVQELRGSRTALEGIEAALAALADPAGRIRGLLSTIEREPDLLLRLEEQERRQQECAQQVQSLDEQLATYRDLDQRISEEEATLQRSRSGYQTYLKHEQVARQLPQRQQACAAATAALSAAEQALRQAEISYRTAYVAFDEQEFLRTGEEIKRLRADLKGYTTALQHVRQRIGELERQIRAAEALLAALEDARQEQRTLEELHAMTEQFRRLLKEAAPQILRARLASISAEANRIFGEIMGERSAQLSWEEDYEICLRSKGTLRTFAQLSGGEQMSAALAVRLALLKKLSSLNIAFFDEPTQNMDLTRRSNLAEQIRRVRGFDQLIVISHDDTFEQGLDALIRLRKEDGETRLLSEEEGQRALEKEEEHAHAP